jgi:hypothetical protein
MRGRTTISILLTAGIFAVLFFGCGGSESPEVPDPPSNLTITFGNDDYQVILHWDPSPSTNIEEYRIYFNEQLIGSVPSDSLSFAYYPDTFGTFSVTASTGKSESGRISAQLPESFYSEEITLDSRGMCAYRLNNNGEPYGASRFSIIDYEGYDFYYGSPENEFLADSIDFYLDTSFTLVTPYQIVNEGRWTRAFHTKFKKIASGATREDFDTASVALQYDESSFSDSVRVDAGDIVEVVAFRDNIPGADSDKIYALLYVYEKERTPDLDHPYIKFSLITQSAFNFRLLR